MSIKFPIFETDKWNNNSIFENMENTNKSNNLLARLMEASWTVNKKPENWSEYQRLNRKRYFERRRYESIRTNDNEQ